MNLAMGSQLNKSNFESNKMICVIFYAIILVIFADN